MDQRSQPLTFRALRRALSEERLDGYSDPTDSDPLDGVARYLWNMALGCAMHPALHAFEVTLRNNIHSASLLIVDDSTLKFKEVRSWLDADPSLLFDREAQAVEEAKWQLARTRRPMTPGRLISKLHLGFWVSLCRAPYEQGRPGGPALWPALLGRAFPHLPREFRTRSGILQRLNVIRDLRNRVSHHEPVWDRDLLHAHAAIVETLSWLNKGMAAALDAESRLPEVVDEGHTSYREAAGRIIRRG